MVSHSRHPVHYELFVRRTPQASWTLYMANEDRAQTLEVAETLLEERKAVAVKVNKELFDETTGEFTCATILTKGVTEPKAKLKLAPETDTVCTSPQDLYTLHAREKISRLLEDWLKRQRVTPFELLHRPDLAEKLDASNNELQHVVQKLAVPESHETGQDLHDLMRRWRGLIDRSIARVIDDGRKRTFPDIDLTAEGEREEKAPNGWLGVIDRLSDHPERAYVLGGAVARCLATATGPAAKLEILLVLCKRLNANLRGREWAMPVVEVPVAELFGARTALNDLLGFEADLGESLAVLTRMAAGPEVDLVAKYDPRIARIIPPLSGALSGYRDLMVENRFPVLSQNISKRLIAELKGQRRLRPGNPEGEIDTLRALALCLTAAGKEETQRDDIRDAFSERSKMLVSTDFVDALVRESANPAQEVERLIWLCENVVGAANKRQAARWLTSSLGGLKFEREMRDTSRQATARLTHLAQLQARVRATQLPETEAAEALTRLGHVGGLVVADAHLWAHIHKSSASPLQKLAMLLGYATGQAGPTGPVSEGAKTEVMKYLRTPELRQALGATPDAFSTLRPMMRAAGIAA